GAAAALDMLTTCMQDVAGSAPMYGNGGGGDGGGSFMADEGSFRVSRFGMGSSRSMGPMQNTSHSPLEESLAGGKAYNRTTMPEARVVRHGPRNASLDSGSWQSLTADMAQPQLNGGGGRSNGAEKNIHATTTTNVGGSGRGDVATATTAPLTDITTPRRSIDTTTEGGSASGLASSSASGAVPMVLKRLRKTAFRKSGGSSGGGGGGSGSGGLGSPEGAEIRSAAAERKAAEQPGPPGKHRRAIRGLFGFGSWRGQSRQFGESAAAAAAAAATQPLPSTRLSLMEAHENAHSLIRTSDDSQDTEIK
ncbi:hypothetical protein Vafri_11115, partial [Volvox africanus]